MSEPDDPGQPGRESSSDNDATPASSTDRVPGSRSSHQDPMSADKRVLVIGLVAMLLLVSVGVVSAALFTTSACADVELEAAEPGPAGSSLAAVTDEVADAGDLEALVDDLTATYGPLIGAANVDGATSLTLLSDAIGALGEVTTVLDATGSAAMTAAQLDDPGVIVGGGRSLYSLALVNQLTGQVDAFAPLGPDLEPGTCIDTAVVGEPFAFHLDAGSDDLLLFRLEEDSDDPEFELRDRLQGRVWISPIAVPVAPPGILAERVTAALGEDLVVGARRVIPGEDQPAVFALDRQDGAERWATDLDALPMIDDEPVWIEVVGVEDDLVLLAVADDTSRDQQTLLALDAADGSVLWWADDVEVAEEVLAVSVDSGFVRTARADGGGQVTLVSLDRTDGTVVSRDSAGAGPVALADGPEGGSLSVGADSVIELRADGEVVSLASIPASLEGRDAVLRDDGTLTVLVAFGEEAQEDGPQVFALTFEGGG